MVTGDLQSIFKMEIRSTLTESKWLVLLKNLNKVVFVDYDLWNQLWLWALYVIWNQFKIAMIQMFQIQLQSFVVKIYHGWLHRCHRCVCIGNPERKLWSIHLTSVLLISFHFFSHLQSSSASSLRPFRISLSSPFPTSASQQHRLTSSVVNGANHDVIDTVKQQNAPPLADSSQSVVPSPYSSTSSTSSTRKNTPHLPVAPPDAAADANLPPVPAVGGGGDLHWGSVNHNYCLDYSWTQIKTGQLFGH